MPTAVAAEAIAAVVDRLQMARRALRVNQVSPETTGNQVDPETPARTPSPHRLPRPRIPIARPVKPLRTVPQALRDPRDHVETLVEMETPDRQLLADLQDRPAHRDQMDSPGISENPVHQAPPDNSLRDPQSLDRQAQQGHPELQALPEARETREKLETPVQRDPLESVADRVLQAHLVAREDPVNLGHPVAWDPATIAHRHELLRAIEVEDYSPAQNWKEIERIEEKRGFEYEKVLENIRYLLDSQKIYLLKFSLLALFAKNKI